jgi:endonuclease YncB( thermonuclease family)
MAVRIGPQIAIVDNASGADPSELPRIARALEKQVNLHFSRPPPYGYGIGCRVRVVTPAKPLGLKEWELGLFREPDIESALGYHSVTDYGRPLMKVFPMLDAGDGVHWSVTASHEILETLADPGLYRSSQDWYNRFLSIEVADPVERDVYEINGVQVSNFVLPSYFEPPIEYAKMPLDHMGLIKEPFEIRPGGYQLYWTSTQWKEAVSAVPKRAFRAGLSKIVGRNAQRKAKAAPYVYSGVLIRVVDGDTVILKINQIYTQDIDFGFYVTDAISVSKTTEQRFRLRGINAPELATAEGRLAKAALEALLSSTPTITIRSYKTDRYGRWLCDLAVGGLDVASEMVRLGQALRV